MFNVVCTFYYSSVHRILGCNWKIQPHRYKICSKKCTNYRFSVAIFKTFYLLYQEDSIIFPFFCLSFMLHWKRFNFFTTTWLWIAKVYFKPFTYRITFELVCLILTSYHERLSEFINDRILQKDRFVEVFVNHFSTLQSKLHFLSNFFVYSSI